MQYVFPIVGGRKVEHLKGNIEALGVELTPEEIDEIEDTEPFDVGFPQSFLFPGKPYRTRYTTQDMPLVTANTALESIPKPSVRSASLLLHQHTNMLTANRTKEGREDAQPELEDHPVTETNTCLSSRHLRGATMILLLTTMSSLN